MKWIFGYITTLALISFSACVYIINVTIGTGSGVVIFSTITLMCTVALFIGYFVGTIFFERL